MAFVIFRTYKGEVISIFPESPGSAKPRECKAFSLAHRGFFVDYDRVMYDSKPTKPKEYRELLELIRKTDKDIKVIQQASDIMHERRKKALPDFVEQMRIDNKIARFFSPAAQ